MAIKTLWSTGYVLRIRGSALGRCAVLPAGAIRLGATFTETAWAVNGTITTDIETFWITTYSPDPGDGPLAVHALWSAGAIRLGATLRETAWGTSGNSAADLNTVWAYAPRVPSPELLGSGRNHSSGTCSPY
jgi:hypothetical protein